jgi:hypothetical protein
MDNNKPKIISKMLDELLSSTFGHSYPQDKDKGVRKFSIDTKNAVENSPECLLAVAQILVRTGRDLEATALTAFASGIVIGYTLKETQIEKIIDDIEKT